MINMQFVNDIMEVLLQEIDDKDTVQRIAAKLANVYMLHEDS
jgi:hypothetical protein